MCAECRNFGSQRTEKFLNRLQISNLRKSAVRRVQRICESEHDYGGLILIGRCTFLSGELTRIRVPREGYQGNLHGEDVRGNLPEKGTKEGYWGNLSEKLTRKRVSGEGARGRIDRNSISC